MFLPELYEIYRYARITAVHIQMEVTNTGSVPLAIATATLPFASISLTGSPLALMERPRSVFKSCAGSGGVSKAVIRKLFHSFDELGNPTYDHKYWVDVTQAASATPQDTNEPAIACAVGALDETSTWAAIVTYRITYHIQWFELNYADVVPDPARSTAFEHSLTGGDTRSGEDSDE